MDAPTAIAVVILAVVFLIPLIVTLLTAGSQGGHQF